MPFRTQCIGAHKYCEQLVGSFTWLPFLFLFLIILVGVGNSVTFHNVTKNGSGMLLSYTHPLFFPAQVLPMGSPREGISMQWRKILFRGAALDELSKTKVLLQSSTSLPLCFHWLHAVPHPLTALPRQRVCLYSRVCLWGALILQRIMQIVIELELPSTLSDSGKDIPC